MNEKPKPGPWTWRTWTFAIVGGITGSATGSLLAYLMGWTG